MRKQRQSFSREFKLEAVRLMEEGKKPPTEIARELGIRRNQIYKWKEKTDQHGARALENRGTRFPY
jgi:transposase